MSEFDKESRFRSILKSLTWRITATLTTIAIARIITGDIEIALKIGAIEVVLKMCIYYFHERIWQLVPRGTVRKILKKKHGNV